MMKKAVFVTGSSTGTGFACAERFALEGYDVFITSREEEKAKKAAAEIAQKHGVFAMGFGLEVGNEERVKEVFKKIDETGRFVKTVILNAANLGFGTDPAKGMDFFETDIEDIRNVFETNLIWNYMVIRQAALRMRDNGEGAVVFISSNTAYRAIPNRAAYSASKGGINAMARALAVDLGPFGIRVNVVLPGTIKTERWQKMGSKQIVNGKLTPIGDISDFEDIANAAWYLGSEQSKNVTGTEITVDGGMTCQLYPKYLNELAKRYLDEN